MLFHPNVFLSTNMSGSFFTVDVDTVGWTLQVLFDDNGPAADASINPAGESKPAEGGTAVSGETAAPTNSTDTQPAPAAESGTGATANDLWSKDPSAWTLLDVKAEMLKYDSNENIKTIIYDARRREDLNNESVHLWAGVMFNSDQSDKLYNWITKPFWEREPSSWTIEDVKAELLKHTPEESVRNIITGASSREDLQVEEVQDWIVDEDFDVNNKLYNWVVNLNC